MHPSLPCRAVQEGMPCEGLPAGVAALVKRPGLLLPVGGEMSDNIVRACRIVPAVAGGTDFHVHQMRPPQAALWLSRRHPRYWQL